MSVCRTWTCESGLLIARAVSWNHVWKHRKNIVEHVKKNGTWQCLNYIMSTVHSEDLGCDVHAVHVDATKGTRFRLRVPWLQHTATILCSLDHVVLGGVPALLTRLNVSQILLLCKTSPDRTTHGTITGCFRTWAHCLQTHCDCTYPLHHFS